MKVEHLLILSNAFHACQRIASISIEILVARLTLAQAHALDVGDEQLHLVVGDQVDRIELACRQVVLHTGNAHKRLVVESLCQSAVIACRPVCCFLGKKECGVKIFVMEIICPLVITVDTPHIDARTARKHKNQSQHDMPASPPGMVSITETQPRGNEVSSLH